MQIAVCFRGAGDTECLSSTRVNIHRPSVLQKVAFYSLVEDRKNYELSLI